MSELQDFLPGKEVIVVRGVRRIGQNDHTHVARIETVKRFTTASVAYVGAFNHRYKVTAGKERHHTVERGVHRFIVAATPENRIEYAAALAEYERREAKKKADEAKRNAEDERREAARMRREAALERLARRAVGPDEREAVQWAKAANQRIDTP